AQSPQVTVKSVGMTVSDMDRSMAFYSELAFQKVSDVEVLGEQYEHLEGVFGARMRIVRMQLGNEYLDLTEYLTPRGRLIPADSHREHRSQFAFLSRLARVSQSWRKRKFWDGAGTFEPGVWRAPADHRNAPRIRRGHRVS